MEHTMPLEVRGELNLVSYRSNSCQNRERSNPAWKQFLGPNRGELGVRGAQEHLVTDLEFQILTVLVRVSLLSGARCQESILGVLLGVC